MPEYNPIKFLLNQGNKETSVGAPAFSITKVLATAAIIIAPLATILVDRFANGVKFTDGQYVVFAVALLAFLAILGAADVLARAYVTARKPEHVYPYPKSWQAHAANSDVTVVGELDTDTYLVMKNGTLMLVPKDQVSPPEVKVGLNP